jgi:hypothetical protein
MKRWDKMIKDGEGPYDSTGVYPCGVALVGEYVLTEPDKFVIVRVDELEDLERKAKEDV